MTNTEWATELSAAWTLLFPAKTTPPKSQWMYWLLRHDPAVLQEALTRLAAKHLELEGTMDTDYMAKLVSSIANRLTRELQKRQADRLALGWDDPFKAFQFVCDNYLAGPAGEKAANRAVDLLEVLCDNPANFWDLYFRDAADMKSPLREQAEAMLK